MAKQPTWKKYSKFIAAGMTSLVGVVTIAFGADAKITLGVVAAVAPFVVLFAPKNVS